MTNRIPEDFARFSQDRLRPAIETVVRGKKTSLLFSVVAAAGLFVVFALGLYFLLSPYRDFLGQSGVASWPLFLLLPAAMAVVCFSIIYILSLRRVVGDFRTTIIAGLATYIDPNLRHEAGRPAGEAMQLLFSPQEKVRLDADHFAGDIGNIQVVLAPLVVGTATGEFRSGTYIAARFPRRFRGISLLMPPSATTDSGAVQKMAAVWGVTANLAERNVADGRRCVESEDSRPIADFLARAFMPVAGKTTTESPRLVCGDHLLVVISPAAAPGKEGRDLFDRFDVAAMREFCHDGARHLDAVRRLTDVAGLWEAQADT